MSSAARKYRCIGKGFCGSVWTLETTGTGTAIKREDGGPGRSVTNDYNMHLQVQHGSLEYQPLAPLSVPQCHQLVEATDAWWETRLPQFPVGYSACRALVSERIPKVPRAITDKIVDLFCQGNTRLCDFVKTNPDDDACLIRPYLGRRRRRLTHGVSNSRFQRFSLRNVPLHVDQMEALGLDTNAYAETMAHALAFMHWVAKIDANDVEFVLAPPRDGQVPETPVFYSEYLGRHSMWILDFDCCHPISMDDVGVDKACQAFFKNDPFYPRPGSKEEADQQLWAVFKDRFLQSSRVMLKSESKDTSFLAESLMSKIEQWRA